MSSVDDVMTTSARREQIHHIYAILERGTLADEQLQVWRDTVDIKAVVDRLIHRTMSSIPC